MNFAVTSKQVFLFIYFISIIAIGTYLLALPVSWGGDGDLAIIDALFTSVSAVCVTGLIVVDTAEYTMVGKIFILLLIQTGGLGIITISTLSVTVPGKKLSLVSQKIIKEYFIDTLEHDPLIIVRKIILFTFIMEFLGFIALFIGFTLSGSENPLFQSIFHSISAFCNAGFSTFSDNLEAWRMNVYITIPVMILIITGGLGFVVVQDILKKMFTKKHRIIIHSKIVITMTLILIITGTFSYFLLEMFVTSPHGINSVSIHDALFQSVTTRTAGFNTVSQGELSLPSKFISLLLMFIGGSPGSIAGGVKTATFFLIIWMIIRGPDKYGNLRYWKQQIPERIVHKAHQFILRAFGILFVCIFSLCVTETIAGKQFSFIEMVFESFSAFATVGLSLGITGSLSFFGKIAVIITMFAGRVGLISMAMPLPVHYTESYIDYPEEEVLIG
ncbi:MAG: potassium transporter TrkG [Spirochaetia bacterium]